MTRELMMVGTAMENTALGMGASSNKYAFF